MVALKNEHQPLLSRIAADGGMEPATRVALIEHVLEEEAEHLKRIVALTGTSATGGARQVSADVAMEKDARLLTVGSLRPAEPRSTATLASVEKDAAMMGSLGSSAGSLPRRVSLGSLRPGEMPTSGGVDSGEATDRGGKHG